MNVLLDTHSFLWLITGDKKLSQTAQDTFLNLENSVHFSAASMWEICIKISLGKLSLNKGWFRTIKKELKLNNIEWLPIEMVHCHEISKLPFYHRDPFDRMLISQAMVENMAVMSRDEMFAAYEINRIW